MRSTMPPPVRLLLSVLCAVGLAGCVPTSPQLQHAADHVILAEQRTLGVRDPSTLQETVIPKVPSPRTVTAPRDETEEYRLTLDEAIRTALVNARVVRVLAGISASSSGSTIYDPAISNTVIDQQQGPFDPEFFWRNTVTRTETPVGGFDVFNPGLSVITGTRNDDYRLAIGLNKRNVLGGTWGLTATQNPQEVYNIQRGQGLILNPQNRRAFELSYTQPLLQGGGFHFNTAPIVIARIDTERSYFQLKDAVQESVRGVIEAYWNLVQARVDVWARNIQVEQSEEAYKRADARQKVGLINIGEVAQAEVTRNQFRASLVAAKNTLLNREGALRNILGLPPEDTRRLVPVSVPTDKRLRHEWEGLLRLAERYRPDVIELKLVLEADRLRLLQADNATLPRLDASALYRWNGLNGELANGKDISTNFGQFADWQFGVNFSVPVGFRQARAQVRQAKLIIARDTANVQQTLHAALHNLAINIRELDNSYDQYVIFKDTRAAALKNLRLQIEEFRAGRVIYLTVLQAINDWGNTITSEAQNLINYNINLANLERQTGTILETHGLVFNEERSRFAGPWGAFGHEECYPSAVRPDGETKRYPGGKDTSENTFDLQKPDTRPLERKEREKAEKDGGRPEVLPVPKLIKP